MSTRNLLTRAQNRNKRQVILRKKYSPELALKLDPIFAIFRTGRQFGNNDKQLKEFDFFMNGFLNDLKNDKISISEIESLASIYKTLVLVNKIPKQEALQQIEREREEIEKAREQKQQFPATPVPAIPAPPLAPAVDPVAPAVERPIPAPEEQVLLESSNEPLIEESSFVITPLTSDQKDLYERILQQEGNMNIEEAEKFAPVYYEFVKSTPQASLRRRIEVVQLIKMKELSLRNGIRLARKYSDVYSENSRPLSDIKSEAEGKFHTENRELRALKFQRENEAIRQDLLNFGFKDDASLNEKVAAVRSQGGASLKNNLAMFLTRDEVLNKPDNIIMKRLRDSGVHESQLKSNYFKLINRTIIGDEAFATAYSSLIKNMLSDDGDQKEDISQEQARQEQARLALIREEEERLMDSGLAPTQAAEIARANHPPPPPNQSPQEVVKPLPSNIENSNQILKTLNKSIGFRPRMQISDDLDRIYTEDIVNKTIDNLEDFRNHNQPNIMNPLIRDNIKNDGLKFKSTIIPDMVDNQPIRRLEKPSDPGEYFNKVQQFAKFKISDDPFEEMYLNNPQNAVNKLKKSFIQ